MAPRFFLNFPRNLFLGKLIVAEIEFGQISLQMSLADVVICPIDRALHDGKVALNAIGVNVAANVIASALIDGTVQRKLAADFLSGPAFVRHDVSSAVDLSPDDWAQGAVAGVVGI